MLLNFPQSDYLHVSREIIKGVGLGGEHFSKFIWVRLWH